MRTSQWKDEKFVERESNTTTWMFELEVLTPIFGGGVAIDGTQKPIDPRTPIRVSAIRGQLRFWWRATNPAGCTTVDELRIAEKRLFGAARLSDEDDVGALSLSVHAQPTTKNLVLFQEKEVSRTLLGGDREAQGIAYGAFALRDKKPFTRHGTITEVTRRLELHVTVPKAEELQDQLACALWAWANFGGVGGRTRRGFGSVNLVAREGVPSHVTFDLKKGWERYSGRFAPRPWPTIPLSFEFAVVQRRASGSSALLALEELLRTLQRLRQGAEVGRRERNPHTKRPGRSYWPEPDSVRKLRRQSAPQHRDPVTRTGEYPRAAFGTPLIIQFGDEGEKAGEPNSSTVNPKGKKRLASPLVLRVARDAAGGLVLRALRLSHPEPQDGFTLSWDQGGRPREEAVEVKLEDVNFGVGTSKSPLIKNGREFTDPIARFFEELKQ